MSQFTWILFTHFSIHTLPLRSDNFNLHGQMSTSTRQTSRQQHEIAGMGTNSHLLVVVQVSFHFGLRCLDPRSHSQSEKVGNTICHRVLQFLWYPAYHRWSVNHARQVTT